MNLINSVRSIVFVTSEFLERWSDTDSYRLEGITDLEVKSREESPILTVLASTGIRGRERKFLGPTCVVLHFPLRLHDVESERENTSFLL